METKVHNLIIVDKSGSMGSVTKQTISGVNETIAGIQASAKKNPEQQQFITLIAFCGCGEKYIFDHVRAEDARRITTKDYEPCCMTPLYDAVGHACICLDKQVDDDKRSAVSVTILTDGYENASREFTHKSVVALINRLKDKGWLFAYIGADHDVESVAYDLCIDNAMEFTKDEEDMTRMFRENNEAREAYSDAMACFMCVDSMSDESILELKKKKAKSYFSRE